jgi:hypothetical protein
MRSKPLSLGLAVGTVLLIAGLPAWALTGTLEIKVPFTFVVQNTTLPAGTYEISTPDLSAPQVLRIRSQNGATSVFVLTEAMERSAGQPQRSELIFNKMGNTEFLTQVWSDEGGQGNQIPEPKLHMQVGHQTMDMKSGHSLAAHHRHTKKQGTS